MEIIDLHCDVLSKLTALEDADFRNDSRLQANLSCLQQGGIKVQVFAIFIAPDVPQSLKFMEVMRQIEAFHTKVLKEPEMVHITQWSQLENLKEHEIGAVLSLEGCDAIGYDLHKLEAVLDAGVKLVGLTWNGENEVAYGAAQNASLGLKPFGKTVIEKLNERNVIIDVSHLNEQSFWDVLPLAKHLIASHSNARVLCNHPRNLTDEQLKALVSHGGHIHTVYYPPFISTESKELAISDLLAHFRYIANLVDVKALGLGSDFDGIDQTVKGLAHAGQSAQLIKALHEVFSEDEVQSIAFDNFMSYVKSI